MENAIYVALSRQMAMARQLDVIANNLANMNTNGYQSDSVLFQEYLMPAGPREQLSFVQDFGLVRDLRAGDVQPTGNSFDVAIAGRGYFVIDTPQGPRYTRNGHFSLDSQGRMVTGAGFPVLGQGGTPIVITDERGGAPTIAPDGNVSTAQGQVVGRLDLVTFPKESALRKIGNGLLTSDEPPQPATGARVHQGFLESSNVRPVVEMTNMIELQRSYQASQRLIDQEHERQRKVIERLARIA